MSSVYRTVTLSPRDFDVAMDYRDAIARLVELRPDRVYSVHLTNHALTITTTGPGLPVITAYTRQASA